MDATPPPGFYLFVTIFWLVVACTILMVLFKIAVWWGERYAPDVNDNDDPACNDMSSEDDYPSLLRPSSLETDRRTDGQTAQTSARRAEQLLTLYRTMRAAGIGREDARKALKEAGLPLNNDVWRKAAPPPKVAQPSNDDDMMVTPYAGRRTRASYYPDEPDLEFQSPN